jgi:hypothetical protein
VRRIDKHLRRHGLLDSADPEAEHESTPEHLTASAVSGQVPPAGPQWSRGLSPPRAAALGSDKPLCASLEGFTLHAATRAGALHLAGREALLRYVLRPPLAQQRPPRGAGDLVRITLKRAYAEGAIGAGVLQDSGQSRFRCAHDKSAHPVTPLTACVIGAQ